MIKTICDSVNHTRFPKEDHLPYWALRDNKVKKGDRVEPVLRLYLYSFYFVVLSSFSSVQQPKENFCLALLIRNMFRQSNVHHGGDTVESALEIGDVIRRRNHDGATIHHC